MRKNENNGFLYRGCWIVDPTLDECTMYRVDPIDYYGDSYVVWLLNRLVNGLPRPEGFYEYS